MNILKLIESFTNEGLLNSKGSRRDSFTQFKKFGANAALAAMPLGLASIALAPQKAGATTTAAAETLTEALQLALTLEYLEEEFYQIGLDQNSLIPTDQKVIFDQILKHESAHVDFLNAGLGNNTISKPTFDFTVGGALDPFNNYDQFLALAQAFEDTGVRAYKGQAGNVKSNPDILQAALQIHSVEAMHASQVRRLRTRLGLVSGQKGWITGNNRGGLPEVAQAVYNGEETTTQSGFNTANVALMNGVSGASAGSESFDEPMTGATATTIASLFIVS